MCGLLLLCAFLIANLLYTALQLLHMLVKYVEKTLWRATRCYLKSIESAENLSP